jgi:hypothetical protein
MQSTNPDEPPKWMLPDFDPNSVTIGYLREIMLYASITHVCTKKQPLVA